MRNGTGTNRNAEYGIYPQISQIAPIAENWTTEVTKGNARAQRVL